MLTEQTTQTYLRILEEELIPAMGCTEPIALAYAASTLRDLLGGIPDKTDALVSGNIVKNAKSVVVPGTGGKKGIQAAVAAGFVAGKTARELLVISEISAAQREEIERLLQKGTIQARCSNSPIPLDITLFGVRNGDTASVRIAFCHTNIVHTEKNGAVLTDLPIAEEPRDAENAASPLNVRDIVTFAETVPLSAVKPLLERQISYNMAIAECGIQGDFGANVGRVLLEGGSDVVTEARALAAAGSDARMSGCEKPVIILSGSGNQGMTASIPIVVWARRHGCDTEKLYRALLISDLVTVHQKSDIGRLSAFCGAVCAGCGAGAGIAYLEGGGYDGVAHTIVNALAILSGMVCDGAKPSCAGKVALAVEAGILGWRMYARGQQFVGGDGIVVEGVDNTIKNVGRLAKEGMRETENEILSIMMEEQK